MADIVNYLADNLEIIFDLVKIVLSIGAYIFAYIIHHKSKIKINALETKNDAEKELMEQLKALKEALERSKNES